MKFTFACKKISLNDSIKEYAEKKISKLDKYFPEEADAFVTFAVEKKNRCVVELTIRAANGTLFRAQTEDPDGDMRSAIDEAVSFIDRRIRKNKTRLAKNLRPDALVSTVPAEFDVVEDNDFDIIRTKRFSVKPMTTDEAVLQMNLLGALLLCVPQYRDERRVRGVPPQQRRLRPDRDGGVIHIHNTREHRRKAA